MMDTEAAMQKALKARNIRQQLLLQLSEEHPDLHHFNLIRNWLMNLKEVDEWIDECITDAIHSIRLLQGKPK